MHSSSKLPKLLKQLSTYQSSSSAKRLLYSLSQRGSEDKSGLVIGKGSDIKTTENKAVNSTFLGGKAADCNSSRTILDSEHNKVKGLTAVDKAAKLPHIEPGVKSLLDKIMDLSPTQLKSLNDHLTIAVEKESEKIEKEVEVSENKSKMASSKVEGSTKAEVEKKDSKDIFDKDKTLIECTKPFNKESSSKLRATEVNFKLSLNGPFYKGNKAEKISKKFKTGPLSQSNSKKADSKHLSKKASSVTKSSEETEKFSLLKTSVKADTKRIKSSISSNDAFQVNNKLHKTTKASEAKAFGKGETLREDSKFCLKSASSVKQKPGEAFKPSYKSKLFSTVDTTGENSDSSTSKDESDAVKKPEESFQRKNNEENKKKFPTKPLKVEAPPQADAPNGDCKLSSKDKLKITNNSDLATIPTLKLENFSTANNKARNFKISSKDASDITKKPEKTPAVKPKNVLKNSNLAYRDASNVTDKSKEANEPTMLETSGKSGNTTADKFSSKSQSKSNATSKSVKGKKQTLKIEISDKEGTTPDNSKKAGEAKKPSDVVKTDLLLKALKTQLTDEEKKLIKKAIEDFVKK